MGACPGGQTRGFCAGVSCIAFAFDGRRMHIFGENRGASASPRLFFFQIWPSIHFEMKTSLNPSSLPWEALGAARKGIHPMLP